VMKRKLKRDSATPSLSSDYAASLEEPNGLRSPSPTKASFTLGPTSNTRDGGWKKATGVMSSNGYFRVFSEVSFISNFFDEYDAKILSQTQDKNLLHSVQLSSHSRTDIRIVDQSLFDEPFCVVINRRPTASPTLNNDASKSTASLLSTNSNGPINQLSKAKSDGPIYLYMPSMVAAQTWMVMAHCYAQPEFLGLDDAADSRSISRSNDYDEDDSDDDDSRREIVAIPYDDERCRVWRTLSISINEGRGIGEIVPLDTSKATSATSSKSSINATISAPMIERISAPFSIERDSFEGYSPRRSESITQRPGPGARSVSRSAGGGESYHRDKEECIVAGLDIFAEIVWQGEVLARTNVSKGTSSPCWRESFTFT
jgi:hypothetical protein